MLIYPWEQLQVTIRSAGVYFGDPGWKLDRVNPYTTIWYMVEGSVDLTINDQQIKAEPGSVVLLPPMTHLQGQRRSSSATHKTIAVRFTLTTIKNLDWFTLYRLPVLYPNKDSFFTEKEFMEIVRASQGQIPSFNHFRTNSLVQLALCKLFEIQSNHIQPINSTKNKMYFQVFQVER